MGPNPGEAPTAGLDGAGGGVEGWGELISQTETRGHTGSPPFGSEKVRKPKV